MDMSFKLLEAQGGIKSGLTLWKVNPVLFREHKYVFTVDSDVLNPRSQDLIRAYDIETYDRVIANPVADQEAIFTDLLMATNPKTARDPKKYIKKAEPTMMTPGENGPEMVANSNPQKGQASMPKPATGMKGLPQNL